MNDNSSATAQAAEVFTKFWTDAMGRMAPQMGTMFGPQPDEVARQMRQAFFDAWERHCEEFMKSEAFLETMKKSMDHAIAFREQMNQLLTKTLNACQMPSHEDTDSILLAVRRLEDRVLKRVDELSRRVESMEAAVGEKPSGSRTRAGKGGAS